MTQAVSRRSVPRRLGFDPKPIDVKQFSIFNNMFLLPKGLRGEAWKPLKERALFQKLGNIEFSYFLTPILRGLVASLNLINISSWPSRSTHGASNVTLGNVVNLTPHWWQHDSVDRRDRAMTDYVCGTNLRASVQLVACLKQLLCFNLTLSWWHNVNNSRVGNKEIDDHIFMTVVTALFARSGN